jgi:hypothetical protein
MTPDLTAFAIMVFSNFLQDFVGESGALGRADCGSTSVSQTEAE